MSFSKKTLLVAMLCATTAQAHNKPRFFEQIKQAFNDGCKATSACPGDTPTHPTVEALGMEAQQKVGVEKPLPIFSMNPHHPMTLFAGAMTDRHGIHVSPQLLLVSYGVARSTMHHEAIHAREHDYQNIIHKVTVGTAAGALAGYATCRKLNRSKRILGVLTGAYLMSIITRQVINQTVEARADREGFKATDCGPCIEEMAANREMLEVSPIFNPFKYFGYVSSKEVAQIAQELKGKTCQYHETPEKQAEAKYNSAVMKDWCVQERTRQNDLAELQAAEHAVTAKEEQCMKRFQ